MMPVMSRAAALKPAASTFTVSAANQVDLKDVHTDQAIAVTGTNIDLNDQT